MNKELENIFLDGLEQNKHKMLRICSIYAMNAEDTKDLFQEVLINIWKSIPSFNAKSSIGTWMFRITLNVCLRLQSSQKRKNKLFRNMDSVLLENLGNRQENKEENWQLIHLRNCINKLNDADKSIITLCLEELPYKEISEITGLTENHIAVKVKRIRNKLFKCIKQRS